jgi:hypothetical protein
MAADQFFSEPQFESYRALGLFTINEMLENAGVKPDERLLEMHEFIEALTKYPHRPPGAPPRETDRTTAPATAH